MEITNDERILRRIRDELMGRYFSNRSELRHMAERSGFNFVPVEFISREDRTALVALRPKGTGEIHVVAARQAPSQPYFITDVLAADAATGSLADAPER